MNRFISLLTHTFPRRPGATSRLSCQRFLVFSVQPFVVRARTPSPIRAIRDVERPAGPSNRLKSQVATNGMRTLATQYGDISRSATAQHRKSKKSDARNRMDHPNFLLPMLGSGIPKK
jgi:hypothetical protein